MPSPMIGRWHGEAVTDEVGAVSSTRCCPPHQSPPATASPHRGSLWRFQKSFKRLVDCTDLQLRISIFFCFSKRKRWRVRNDHGGTNPCKQGFLSSVLVSSFPNRELNLRFGFFYANLRQPLSLGCAEPAPYPLCPFGTFPPDRGNRPLEGEPFVVCIYIGGGQCYTVYITVFSERNDIHGSACKAGTLTTEFL